MITFLGNHQTMRNIYHTLLPMVKYSVLPYLNSSNSDVRKEVSSTYIHTYMHISIHVYMYNITAIDTHEIFE